MPPAFCFPLIATSPDAADHTRRRKLAFAGDLNYQTAMATHAIPLAKLPAKPEPRAPVLRPRRARARLGFWIDGGTFCSLSGPLCC